MTEQTPMTGQGEALLAPEPGELRSLIAELEAKIIEVRAAHCVIDILVFDTLSHIARDPRLSAALNCSCEVLETRIDTLEQNFAHLYRVSRGQA